MWDVLCTCVRVRVCGVCVCVHAVGTSGGRRLVDANCVCGCGLGGEKA